jgi:hypothetical protein
MYRYKTMCVPDAAAEMVVNIWTIGSGLLSRYLTLERIFDMGQL